MAFITGITLKLSGIPEEYSAGIATFEKVEDATGSVNEIMAYGLVPAALELLDADAVRYINQDGKIPLDEKPTLFLEFTGSNRGSLAENLKQAEEVCRNHQCLGFQPGVGRNERNRLWEARHGFGESLIRGNPGFDVLIIDTACPLSQFPAMVKYATQTAADYGLKACISSHAGDGNLHLNIVGKMQDNEFVERLNRAYDQIVSFAISKGGTATGEHGVGIGKRKFMQQEHGFGIEIMRSIKQCFDPKGILNPGKIFP